MQKQLESSDTSSNLRKKVFFDYLGKRKNHTTLSDVRNLKADYGGIIPCFIYDQMMKGECEDAYLEPFPFFGPATTHEEDFVMFKKSGVPLMFQKTRLIMTEQTLVNTIDCRRVQGELYGLTLDMVCYLDQVYRNHSLYERTEIPIVLHTPDHKTHYIKHAMVWLAVYDKWKVEKTIRDKFVRAPIINSMFIPDERPYRAFSVQKIMFPKEVKPTVWKNDYSPSSAGINPLHAWPDVDGNMERIHPFGNEFGYEMGGGGV